jgi:O-antigen/teichoic acid export membrane protein
VRIRIRDIWRGLGSGGMARSVAIIAGGSAAGQAIVILSSPVITRLYSPAEFGTLAAYAALINVVAVAASLRLDTAILLPLDDDDAANVLALAIGTTTVLSLALAGIVWLFGAPFLEYLGAVELVPLRWLFPVSMFAIGVLQSLSYWGTRRRAFRVVAQTKVAQGAGAVGTQIGLGLLNTGATGLVIGHVLGQSTGSVNLLRDALRNSRNSLSRISISGVAAALRRYARHAAIATPGGLLNTVGLVMPALLLTNLYGVQAAGWYALAQRVVGTPLKLLTGSVAQVYLPEAARLAKTDPRALMRLFLRSSLALSGVALSPILVVVAFGPQLVGTIFGEAWVQAGQLARLLTISYVAQVIASPLSNTLYAIERPGVHTVVDGVRAGLTVLSLTVPSAFGYSLDAAIFVYSVTMGSVYVLYWLLTWWSIGRAIRAHEAS